jgi:hypothetical protein
MTGLIGFNPYNHPEVPELTISAGGVIMPVGETQNA